MTMNFSSHEKNVDDYYDYYPLEPSRHCHDDCCGKNLYYRDKAEIPHDCGTKSKSNSMILLPSS